MLIFPLQISINYIMDHLSSINNLENHKACTSTLLCWSWKTLFMDSVHYPYRSPLFYRSPLNPIPLVCEKYTIIQIFLLLLSSSRKHEYEVNSNYWEHPKHIVLNGSAMAAMACLYMFIWRNFGLSLSVIDNTAPTKQMKYLDFIKKYG